MNASTLVALTLLAGGPLPQEPDVVAGELRRLQREVATLEAAVRERDGLLTTVRDRLTALQEELRDLRERPPQPLAAAFLASPPDGSDKLGVARAALFAPRIDADSPSRRDTVLLKVKRIEPAAVRTVAEIELTPELNGIDLPLDLSGWLYVVEWSTTEGQIYNLVLRDGASGQPVASVPVKERQSQGRFVFVGYLLD